MNSIIYWRWTTIKSIMGWDIWAAMATYHVRYFFAFALYSEQGTANTLLKDQIFFLLNNSTAWDWESPQISFKIRNIWIFQKKVHFNHFNPCTAWASFTGESGGEIRWSHALPQLQGCSYFLNLFSYFSSNNILHYMSFYIICHKLCYFLKDFMFINVFIRFPS